MKLEHRDEDRIKADSLMKRTCANRTVKILEEGEVAIGTITNSSARDQQASEGIKVGSLFGLPVTSGGNEASRNTASVTTQKKEWQIKFNCGRVAKVSTKTSIQ